MYFIYSFLHPFWYSCERMWFFLVQELWLLYKKYGNTKNHGVTVLVEHAHIFCMFGQAVSLLRSHETTVCGENKEWNKTHNFRGSKSCTGKRHRLLILLILVIWSQLHKNGLGYESRQNTIRFSMNHNKMMSKKNKKNSCVY